MKIRIVSELDSLAYEVAADLERADFKDQGSGLEDIEVEVEVGTSHSYSLRHAATVSPGAIGTLLDHLSPMRPPSQRFDDLEGADIELRLGDSRPLRLWNARIYADSGTIATAAREAMGPLGLDMDEAVSLGFQARNVVTFGGASMFARHAVRWALERKLGIALGEVKEWGDDDQDLWIRLRDPAHHGKPARACFPLVVETDDPKAAEPLLQQLREARFQISDVVPIPPGQADRNRFRIDAGPLDEAPAEPDSARLRLMVDDFMASLGVDTARYPLEAKSIERRSLELRVRLPLGAYAAETLRPYAGPHPERFPVLVRTDDPAVVSGLVDSIRALGFPEVEIVPFSDATAGFTVHWGALAKETALADRLRGAVEATMATLDLPEGFTLGFQKADEEDDPRVQIDFPTTGLADGSRLARIIERASAFEATIYCETGEAPPALFAALERLGFRTLSTRTESGISEARIKYGGAPPPLVSRIRELVGEHLGVETLVRKEWADYDDDIWIYLPTAATDALPVTSEELDVDLGEWLAPASQDSGAEEPFVTVSADTVRIGDVVLPRRPIGDGSLVPDPSRFAHYTIDQSTGETLHHLALSVLLREPCLLEGPTSTSKTSSVLYLASLLRQPVVRLNLNGQTDTGELVGRFLPSGASDTTDGADRSNPWRWHDGLVVGALKAGWWVILDEVNLAEPQILERLNSVLEREPMLVLTEHDNRVVGPGGEAVHPDFRIFATMNPAEYAGRSALSPAYRDRWLGYRFVNRPTEGDYEAMLRFIVRGQGGEVTIHGETYAGSERPAACASLAEVPNIDGFIRCLARFHAGMEHATFGGGGGGGGARLGSRRKEPYVFTRRGLLGVMRYLEMALATGGDDPARTMRRALMRYYLGRIAAPSDRAVVVRLLDAAGLGPTTWQLDAPQPGDRDLDLGPGPSPEPRPGPGPGPGKVSESGILFSAKELSELSEPTGDA